MLNEQIDSLNTKLILRTYQGQFKHDVADVTVLKYHEKYRRSRDITTRSERHKCLFNNITDLINYCVKLRIKPLQKMKNTGDLETSQVVQMWFQMNKSRMLQQQVQQGATEGTDSIGL